MMTPQEIERAALDAVGESGACATEDLGGGVWRVRAPSGRHVRIDTSSGTVAVVDVNTSEALGVLFTEQGTGFDSASALDLIRTHTGATSDAEATRRALAVCAFYLGQI